MSRENREPEYPAEMEYQFILRLPEEPAAALREVLRSGGNIKDRLTIRLDTNMRHGHVRFDHWLMQAKIVDLPAITESLKTIDNKNFYKTADVTQMMICSIERVLSSVEGEASGENKLDPCKVDKKYLWPHGITPPTKNIRKRRFRKTHKKKCKEAPRIQKEVKHLLCADNEACGVTWEIVTEDEKLSTHEGVAPTQIPKTEEKRGCSGKNEDANTDTTSETDNTNIVDIFGEVVSDSEPEDDTINIEVKETQLLPEEFVVPTYSNTGQEVEEESDPKSEEIRCSKENEDKKNSEQTTQDNYDDDNYDTCTITEYEAVFEDERDYREACSSKANMTIKIAQVGVELEQLKLRKQKMQHGLLNLENKSLKQRFVSVLHTLSQDLMFKELEYLGLVTMLNSDDI